MYKNLFTETFTLENSTAYESYYKLGDIFNFLTDDLIVDVENSKSASYFDGFNKPFLENLKHLRNTGLPHKYQEQFNHANLAKLYGLDILSRKDREMSFDKFDYLAIKNNTLVLCDGEILVSNNLGTRKPFNVQILDKIHTNKSRQLEYVKYVKHTNNFSNLTYALSPFLNIVVFPTGSKDRFYKNPVTVDYRNIGDEPFLSCNTTIFDVQHNTKVCLKEDVKTLSGQMNNSIYILRENSELVLERKSNDYGGWNIFDSTFICHPKSKLIIDTKNTGSIYTQENFYIDSTYHTNVKIKGRNKIFKGNNFHQYVYQKSNDVDNYSRIDIKNIGNEYADTSFIGRYDVGPFSVNFDGSMNNNNLMLSKNTKMHTRPILDIKTKEIQCQHGCTVSNINTDQLYYLQSRGVDNAKDLLVESFLC